MDIEFNKEHLEKLGNTLRGKFTQWAKERRGLEQQWLKNLRQYRGEYDPEVKNKIPVDRSSVYPKDTRTKGKGFVAKMMEMMFPASEENWQVTLSEIPSIGEEDLQRIIEGLRQADMVAAQQEQRPPREPTSQEIEDAVVKFAKTRAKYMEEEILDQLADEGVDYPQIAKRVVRSGWLYGHGIAKAPLVQTKKERVWELDEETGRYEAKTKTERRPYPEYLKVWDAYPDLSAPSWEEQEWFFERLIMGRNRLLKLTKRPDFMEDAIRKYLRENPEGNFKAQTFETELRELNGTEDISDEGSRKFEVLRGVGFLSGHELEKLGLDIDEDEREKDIFVEVYFIDGHVIKVDKAPFGENVADLYHIFVYSEDEESGLTGVGGPQELRDSQMSICAVTRALMDNLAASAGPIVEANRELLCSDNKNIGALHSFQVVYREGLGSEANYPALRDISIDSHVNDILPVLQMLRSQLDVESNIPQWTLGNNVEPLGEAFRTSGNMSQLAGGANMVTKDVVRGFDKFTTSIIGSFLKWNMEFNEREEIKGDFQVQAKGAVSLVAKEVRGAALDQFVQTLTEEERALLDVRGLLVDRLKSRDLPTDRVVGEQEARQILDQMAQSAAQAQAVEQGLTQAKTEKEAASTEKIQAETGKIAETADATVAEILSRVQSNISRAESEEQRVQLENFKALLEAVAGDEQPTATQGEQE